MRCKDRRYLLRVWQDGHGKSAWRASLRPVDAQAERYFASAAALLAYLGESSDEGDEAAS